MGPVEPGGSNDTIAEADTAFNNYFYGTISGPRPSSDVDIYGFRADQGDLLFISLDCDPLRDGTPIDLQLQLLDMNGNVLVGVDGRRGSSYDYSPGFGQFATTPFSPAEGLTYRVRKTGFYYAKVFNTPVQADAGDYLLSISKNCERRGGGIFGLLQFSQSNYTVNENGGSITVTVDRTLGADRSISVDFATSDGTAIAGQDYTSTSGTLTFAQGVTSRTFTIPITNDVLDEASETINLTLSDPTNGAILGTRQTATLTITDDDPLPSLSVNNRSVREGDRGTNFSDVFRVSLSAVSGKNVRVIASTASNAGSSTPAMAGIDYISTTAIIQIPAGSQSANFEVPIIGDIFGEPNENFLVNLSTPVEATISTGQAVGTILNDDFIDTIGVFRPSTGQFLLRNTNSSGPADIVVPFGGPGAKPVAGDWDGDGIDDVGIFNPSTGQFILRQPVSVFVGIINGVPTFTTIITVITVNFGQAGDLPVVGDWNGDSIDTVGIYRPPEGRFILRNSNNDNPSTPDLNFLFGAPNGTPLAGDWNADGIDTIGVRNDYHFNLRNSNSAGPVDINPLAFGTGTDLPVMGDWDANGSDTPGVLQFESGAFKIFISNNFIDSNVPGFPFGAAGDIPIAGNWSRKAGDNNPPNSGVNDPGNGSSRAGHVQQFTTTCSDPDGWHDIHTIDFKIAKSNGNGNGVPLALWVQFLEDRNLIRFYDPDTQAWSEGALGSATVLSSRFAELHLAQTSVQGSGPIGSSVQIRWTVVLKGAAVMNNYKQYLQITDDAGLSTGFDRVGSWSVLR